MICDCVPLEFCETHGYRTGATDSVEQSRARVADAKARSFVTDEGFRVYPVVHGWHANYGGGATSGDTREAAIEAAREAVKRNLRLSIVVAAQGGVRS